MPSRNNAVVSIRFDEFKPAQLVYLGGYGRPDDVKEFTRRAFRAQRRVIMGMPDLFFFNFVREVGFRTALHLDSGGARYAWSYKFDLSAETPTVTIWSRLTQIKSKHLLFAWIGVERRNYKEPKEAKAIGLPKPKHRKGRKTAHSGLAVPPPDWFDKTAPKTGE